MNREIKFRAWDTAKNKMYSAEELGNDEVQLHPKGRGFFNASGLDPRLSEYYTHMIPLEFTGLLDKNGKEIYEGDILNATGCELVGYNQNEYGESEIYADSKGKVHYFGAGFCFDGHSAGDLPLDTFDSDALEVIGNIYEHSHLLK